MASFKRDELGENVTVLVRYDELRSGEFIIGKLAKKHPKLKFINYDTQERAGLTFEEIANNTILTNKGRCIVLCHDSTPLAEPGHVVLQNLLENNMVADQDAYLILTSGGTSHRTKAPSAVYATTHNEGLFCIVHAILIDIQCVSNGVETPAEIKRYMTKIRTRIFGNEDFLRYLATTEEGSERQKYSGLSAHHAADDYYKRP
jgi:hypothetical protein